MDSAENNAGLTEEERQRAIELIAAAELKKQSKRRPARAVCDKGVARPSIEIEKPISLMNLEETEEKIPEWLISGYLPKRKVTILAGDGGSGKTTIWCAVAASIIANLGYMSLTGYYLQVCEN